MRILPLLTILLSTVSLRAESLLPPNARVAVIGDSITEQKIYSRYIETYLLACTGRSDIKVFQFGWSGERAGGFAARLENDLAVFNPNVATTCYGMNDGSYTAYTPQIGAEYEKNMRAVIAGLQKVGVKVMAIGSPGGVDPDFFTRPTIKGEIYNENLAHLRDIAKKLAEENKQPFANVHDSMMSALAKSKAALGKEYGPFGGDGFHPAPAGQLLMAQAFLKALGFDGEIGTITVDLKGECAASSGHAIIAGKGGSVTLESSKWPFIFDADPKSAGSNRSILPFTTFNQDLNRLTLKVKNLSAAKAKVTWGSQSKEFTREQLEAGINLAAEFTKTPFDNDFAALTAAITLKENFETLLIKNLVTHMRVIAAEAAEEPKVAAALTKLKKKLADEHAKPDANVRKFIKPVTHTIKVEEIR
ncbi:SGNH/GDSL hydrolase family protein [Prosthecobacter sp.]|uniref:SGNH/GDSL hydrolase family protein n=1 Tax=Prosthecobacter sp. TaxID=1965333 RepID=UPI00248A0A04|nr:SGNH/GDSL hydrolase family protein [Prosthecobacter sp.]MDI1315472.1 SGNH/GDSL hydrolase family protein [Prosthecobacter sp.]